jgi:hypothetical protein
MSDTLIRVLIALDLATPPAFDLEAVRGLGLGGRITLRAAFFEDQSLIDCARLSCAREVSLPDLACRRPDETLMQRQIHRHRERVRQLFFASARTLATERTFAEVRGQAARELYREARDCDVLVMARQGSMSYRPNWMGMRLEQLLESGPATIVLVQDNWSGRPMAVDDASSSSPQALAAAARIATAASQPLTVLHLGQQETYVPEVSAQPGYRRLLETTGDMNQIIDLVRKEGAGCLVIPAAATRMYPDLVSGVLRHCRCSVVICR